MKDEFKGTQGPWVADIRGGCAAIYPASCIDDTPGCHRDDSRNIAYSNKGAKFNGMRWEIDSSVEHDFNLMAAAPELLEALQKMLSKAYKQNWNEQYPDELLLAEESINKALGKKQ